jgi:transposase
MNPEARAELRVRFKYTVLQIAASTGVRKTCREFDVAKSSFDEWKSRFDREGKSGLYRKKPVALTHPRKTNAEIVQKILELRTVCKMGSKKITYNLERYHGMKVSESTVTRIFVSPGLRRLERYAKNVPGHHVQVDVKFLLFKDIKGNTIKRFQYTAIDDATRIRALKIYTKHTQTNAINFIDHVVERSHKTDKDEFYQLLTYTDDVDSNQKLQAWERFYNFNRPHFSHQGRTPYEVMRSLLV